MLLLSRLLFLFVKQKTAYELRIIDWSSDVCSSDLDRAFVLPLEGLAVVAAAIADLERSALWHDVEYQSVREAYSEALAAGARPDGAQAHALVVGALLVVDGLSVRAAPERQAFAPGRTVSTEERRVVKEGVRTSEYRVGAG